MTTTTGVRRCRAVEGTAQLLTVAVCAVLAGAGAAAQTVPHQSPQRGAIGTGLGQSELPKGSVFEPRIEAALQYAGNINLAPDGEPQIDTAGLEFAPGFYASYSTGAVLAAIDYSLIGRAWEDSDFNDVSHRLAANGDWQAVPEWFSVRGQASYSDTVLDPSNGLNYGGLGIFGSGNLAEVATASVNPVLQHQFNDFVVVTQYTYGRTWYLDEGKGQPVVGFVSNQDSVDQSAGVSVGTADQGARLTGRLYYDWQRSEFDTSLPYEFERVGLDAGVQVARTLRLVGEYGMESDLDASTTQGGLDSEFWNAGVSWTPNDRTSAEARIGDRFFGQTYFLEATHRARFLEFSASYNESPTVETRQLSLGGFDPGQLPPGTPEGDFGRLTSSPYVLTDMRASVAALGSRTTVTLTGFQYERDYLRDVRGDETGTGGSIGATRQLGSNLSTDFNITYTDYGRTLFAVEPVAPDTSSDYDTQVTLRLNRTSGPRLTVSAETGYLQRRGNQEYDGWWVALRTRWTP